MSQHSQESTQIKQQLSFISDVLHHQPTWSSSSRHITNESNVDSRSHGCRYRMITQTSLSGRLLHSEPHDDGTPLMRGSIGYACFYCPSNGLFWYSQCGGRPFAITTVWKHRKYTPPCCMQYRRYVQSSYSVQQDRPRTSNLTFQSLPVTLRTNRFLTFKNSAWWLHGMYVFCMVLRTNNSFCPKYH
jgi:hypothetical protein